jgi:hypothetical protein
MATLDNLEVRTQIAIQSPSPLVLIISRGLCVSQGCFSSHGTCFRSVSRTGCRPRSAEVAAALVKKIVPVRSYTRRRHLDMVIYGVGTSYASRLIDTR